MKNIIIQVDTKTSKVILPTDTLGIKGENLQGKLRFELSTFIDGEGILLVQQDYDGSCRQNYIHMDKVNNGYEIDIKSSLLKGWKVDLQLQINEPNTGNGTPIFKSNVFFLKVGEQINAGTEIPDEYPSAFVIDENYVHTDNNYTDEDKAKVQNFTPYDDTEIRGEITLVDNKANANATNIVILENTKANATDVYTKSQTNTLLSGKVNASDLSTVATSGSYTDLSNKPTIPSNTSDLINDSNFVNKTYVDTAIAGINTMKIEIVQTLPSTGDSKTIYFVPKVATTNNLYDEYMYIDNNWELIGSTEVDLSNYYTKSQIDTTINGINAEIDSLIYIGEEEPATPTMIWIDTHTLDYIGEALNEIIPDITTTEYDMTEEEIGEQLDEIIGGQE